jgi:hypothetical protein
MHKSRYSAHVGPESRNKYGFFWTEFTDKKSKMQASAKKYQYKRRMTATGEDAIGGFHAMGLAYKSLSLKLL